MADGDVDTVEIPDEALRHPVVIAVMVLFVVLVVAARAIPYAQRTIGPAWRWATGRDTRAYSELLGEVELLRQQLEASRTERALADERHSLEIAGLRTQYESDMRLIQEQLQETRRQLLDALTKGAPTP
ncbi:hypothetical protein [Rhodococcus sp. UNC363MFTsu5.1]|uniref:hypothetical protein n=1 Tax=Rhodococcus sp. UNC363MFTsu5.1 TaxID=1449069 RepID=UPI00048690D0|nr:hypothetical protein [Rhodococcus sp. UNC363MFTsu5.1]